MMNTLCNHRAATFKVSSKSKSHYRLVPHAISSNGSTPIPQSYNGSVVTDQSVPEGHQGLHGLLYGEGGAEAHNASHSYDFRGGEDDGSAQLPIESYIESRQGEKPVGVYAIYDSKRNLQYVGYSRNVVMSVRAHLARVGEDRCSLLRVMVFANKAMQSKAALEREALNWLESAGTLPPGNGAEKELWQESSVNTSLMSFDELAEYEEKKLKMKKAMGENLHDSQPGESVDAKQRRLNLIKAVEGDDWSEVIDKQTQETVSPIVTPFARASVHRAVGEGPSSKIVDMSVGSVDKVLDEVRPYLIADGGNVEVVSVEGGIIALRLQGACGTCPSSSATMKMGIERSLKSAFGDSLKEVIQVGGNKEEDTATVTNVDMHLNMLRGAIHGYGGSVEVQSVTAGVCELLYKGPLPIAYGLRAAVSDKFRDLREVIMLDAESKTPLKF